MKALICGSFAYDNIMSFPDHFKQHILPEKIDILNVSFVVPSMRREFGGCAGNIAYNLNMLDKNMAVPMGTVGNDFDPYSYWLDKNGVDRTHIKVINELFTAQAFIATDLDNNQITMFHPGAMEYAHHNKVTAAKDIAIGIISPDGREAMLQHAAQFSDAGIPFIFDPGQGIPLFNKEELKSFIRKASWVMVNNYEWELIQEHTGYNVAQVTEQVAALVVTLGGRGSVIYAGDKEYQIPGVAVESKVDPTGCGDAHRAGILYGLLNNMGWETTGRIGSLMGAIKIASPGTQNHSFTLNQFKARFAAAFRRDLA